MSHLSLGKNKRVRGGEGGGLQHTGNECNGENRTIITSMGKLQCLDLFVIHGDYPGLFHGLEP